MKGTYKLNDEFYIHSDNMSWIGILCYYIGRIIGYPFAICVLWYFFLEMAGKNWDEKVAITKKVFEFFEVLVRIFEHALDTFPYL